MTNTELLEGLAREAFEKWSEDAPWGSYASCSQNYIAEEAFNAAFQAALQYLQQHVAPVVSVLKLLRNHSSVTAHQIEAIDEALASLPPILRGDGTSE